MAVAAAALAVGPVRAGGAGETGGPRCVEPSGPVELTLWHPLGDALERELGERIDELNRSQDEITVSAVKHPNYPMLVDALATVDSEDLPDLVLANETATLNLASSGSTIPRSECPGSAPLDDLLPVVEATYEVDGQLVATPYNVSTPVLVYNAALLEAAGLDPADPPGDLAALRRMSDAVVAAGVARHGMVLQATYGPWFIKQFPAQRGEIVGIPANGRGGEPVDDLVFATESIAADIQWLRDGLADGAFVWIDTSGGGYDDLLRITTETADAAFTLHTSAALGDVIAVLETGVFPESRLGAAPLPGVGGQVGGGALWVMDTGDPSRAGAAQRVVDHLTEPGALAELAAATGCVPPRRSVLHEPVLVDAWAAHPELRVGYDQLAAMDDGPAAAGLLALTAGEVDDVLWSATYALLHDPVDPLTALAGLEAQGELLLRIGAGETSL
ncbi:extracellular solute-binding protein [Desertimonas flava]|uniref:extracellular solute-binding protein n=1 Tax=Desertimonas flava TaxID=2064846 RepID=UPI0013C3F70C|nr:extracellular solute-binding protein [Desertimonas flava]